MTLPVACPNCQAPMESLSFARHVHGTLVLDVCWPCHVIWFDQFESAQLPPTAVIELFRRIHEHREQPARSLADPLDCPRCQSALVLTHDVQRSTKLRYHRCARGHGRLTGFMQFLREKQFVRSLSQPEIATLKATVAQIRCSSCGATVDLTQDTACRYCRAPIAVLDAQAVEKALAGLQDIEQRRRPNAESMASAFAVMLEANRTAPPEHAWLIDLSSSKLTAGVVDLVVAGIGKLLAR